MIYKPRNTQNSKMSILGYSSLPCGTLELEEKTEIYHSSKPIFKKFHLLYYKFIIKQTEYLSLGTNIKLKTQSKHSGS